MEAYKVFLRQCYDVSLKWAYSLESEEEYATLQAMKSLLPVSIDFESFEDYYHLWKQSTSTSDSRLPLPPTNYIIPYHFAKWNKFKGGSDTLTKLFWNSNHYVPSDTPAAYAVSRLIRFLAAMLYRCDAMMTSKVDLNYYTGAMQTTSVLHRSTNFFDVFQLRTSPRLISRRDQLLHHENRRSEQHAVASHNMKPSGPAKQLERLRNATFKSSTVKSQILIQKFSSVVISVLVTLPFVSESMKMERSKQQVKEL